MKKYENPEMEMICLDKKEMLSCLSTSGDAQFDDVGSADDWLNPTGLEN